MKRIALVILLIFALFGVVLMASHYYPEKVPKKIANAVPNEHYAKIPRQVREYFPWLKPKKPDKPMAVNVKELNRKINETLAEEAAKNKSGPQNTEDILLSVLDDFYQKLAEGTFNHSYDLMHTVSQESFSGDNFVNYYSLLKDTFQVNKITIDKNLQNLAQYKEPTTGKVIKQVLKAKVTFDITNKFSSSKSIKETITQTMYFAQENSQWKIIEHELNNKNYVEKKYYYFLDEGYKRLKHEDHFGAIDYFRKAIRVNSLSLNANYGLSVALYSIAYYDRAVETVQKMESIYKKKYVTKLVTDNVDLKTIKKLDVERLSNGYYIMGCALIKKGNLPGAKYALKKSIELQPNNVYAKTALKTIPITIAAQPAPMLYKEAGSKEDPFKTFKENAVKETKQAAQPAFDPEQAMSMLNSR